MSEENSEMKHRIDEPTSIPVPNQQPVWIAIILIAVAVVLLQALTFIRTEPADVLFEVQMLRSEIRDRTNDRFYHQDFESFLKNNPQLKPPDGW